MARSNLKPVEPKEWPPLAHEAVSIFVDAGWGEDAKWLGPLALSVFKDADGDHAEPLLGDNAKRNIEIVARAWSDAAVLPDRDRALLIAYVRLCGCGGTKAQLRLRYRSIDELEQPPKSPMGLAEWKQIAATFRSPGNDLKGANFEAAIVSAGWPGDYGTDSDLGGVLMEYVRDGVHPVYGKPEILRLMDVLVDGAGLNLTSIIDAGSLAAIGSRRAMPDPAMQLRVPKEIDRTRPTITDARSLTNWMIGLGPRALTMFLSVFRACPNDQYLVAMAVGVQDAIEHWLMCGTHHWTYSREGGLPLAEATRPYFDRLHSHCAHAQVESSPSIRRAWLWFAWCTFEADPNSWDALDPQVREAVLRAANEDISRVRKLLTRAQPRPLNGDERENMLRVLARTGETLPPLTPADLRQGWGHLLPASADGPIEEKQRAPWEEFEWEKDHIRTCLILLYKFGGVWSGLKPMLLAWRSLSAPAVARDLRYWQEPDRDAPPQPWADLIAWPINLFHVYVGREQLADHDLVSLRGELASFCLERLADRWNKNERDEAKRNGRARANDDMLERSPEWRYCLIRAAGTLGVNPEGKGHRILRMAADLDPEADVREAANQCYEQFRRNSGLPEGVSPRRAIMSALWWIRQAHLLGLEIQPDPDGAQRTRVKELARTKETERVHKPATREKQ